MVDILDPRAAPAINRLIVIADHENRRVATRHEPQPGVLNRVGVLEFVDQDMPEAALVVFADVVVIANQFEHTQQQLREIDDAGTLALILIQAVYFEHLLLDRILAGIDMRRPQAFILVVIDKPLRLFGRPARLVQVELTHHALDHAQLVVTVEYLETLRQSGRLVMQAQHAMREPVKGANPHRCS